MVFVDNVGRQIKMGDQIVHAYTVGSSAALHRCVVIDFTPKMMRVQPVEFKRRYRRFSNVQPGQPRGEWVFMMCDGYTKEPVKQTLIKPGSNVLVVNNENWEDLDEIRALGYVT